MQIDFYRPRHRTVSTPMDEARALRVISRSRLVRTFIGGRTHYTANGIVIAQKIAEALISQSLLIPCDPGLLNDVPQSWCVRYSEDALA